MAKLVVKIEDQVDTCYILSPPLLIKLFEGVPVLGRDSPYVAELTLKLLKYPQTCTLNSSHMLS